MSLYQNGILTYQYITWNMLPLPLLLATPSRPTDMDALRLGCASLSRSDVGMSAT